MSIEAVSSAVVAIYLCEEELNLHGLTPPLSAKDARILVSEHLKSRGETPWPRMEIELYSSSGALLLVARPSCGERHVFRFSDFEALIEAVSRMGCEPPSRLTYFEGEYYLGLGLESRSLPAALYEYGDYIPAQDGLFAHISEHGEIVISELAVTALCDFFS